MLDVGGVNGDNDGGDGDYGGGGGGDDAIGGIKWKTQQVRGTTTSTLQ